MLNRFIKLGLAAFLTTALGAGTAIAQDDPCADEFGDDMENPCGDDFGDDAMGDDAMADDAAADDAVGDDAAADGDATADASVSASAPAAGAMSFGAKAMLPSGLTEDLDIGLGSWMEINLWGRYNVSPKLSVGLELPLLLLSPGEGDGAPSIFQGAYADGRFHLNEMLHVNGFLGFGPAGRMLINPWGGLVAPGSGADNKVGLGAGAGIAHQAGKISILADANLKVQLDSDVNDDGEAKPGIVIQVPVWALYSVSDKLAAGVMTGIYSGAGVKFSADDGMTIPLVAGAMFDVSPQISAGGFAGFSSVLVPEGLGIADSLTVGAVAEYKM